MVLVRETPLGFPLVTSVAGVMWVEGGYTTGHLMVILTTTMQGDADHRHPLGAVRMKRQSHGALRSIMHHQFSAVTEKHRNGAEFLFRKKKERFQEK